MVWFLGQVRHLENKEVEEEEMRGGEEEGIRRRGEQEEEEEGGEKRGGEGKEGIRTLYFTWMKWARSSTAEIILPMPELYLK